MHIAGLSFTHPERAVSNEELVRKVALASRESLGQDLDKALNSIRFYLHYIGAENRYFLSAGEQAFQCTRRAVQAALGQAHLKAREVDLLIYASVDKRVMEPGMAFFFAKALGLEKAQCFDVTEACAGWTRATQIAQSFLQTGAVTNVLIVTSEYLSHEGQLLSKNHRLDSLADLEWAFAGLTVGEGSTATVLTHDDRKPWRYTNRTFSQWADLCVIPTWHDDISTMHLDDVSMSAKGLLTFMSHGKKMQDFTMGEIVSMFKENPTPVGDYDLFIPHTNTVSAWPVVAAQAGVEVQYHFMLPRYGNLVTNSIPAGLAVAQQSGKLARGDTVGAMMTAAGMSYTLYDFIY